MYRANTEIPQSIETRERRKTPREEGRMFWWVAVKFTSQEKKKGLEPLLFVSVCMRLSE